MPKEHIYLFMNFTQEYKEQVKAMDPFGGVWILSSGCGPGLLGRRWTLFGLRRPFSMGPAWTLLDGRGHFEIPGYNS